MGATHSHVCRAHSLFSQAFRLHSLYSASRSDHSTTNSKSSVRDAGVRGLKTNTHNVDVRVLAREHRYQVLIGRDLLDQVGRETRRALGPHPNRIALISNQKIFKLYGDAVVRSLRRSQFTVAHWLMGDGERFKSLSSLEKALQFLA